MSVTTRWLYFVGFLLVVIVFVLVMVDRSQKSRHWKVKSIDTMKYSRDLALEKINDPNFDKNIELQMENISKVGATHVAIGTPYDKQFLPFLVRWVKIARDKKLKVWFRSNFSGWEGWFGYQKLGPQEHMKMTEDFILNNKELFEAGDIFTSCTECENGGSGDPRQTGKLKEYREFLIEENVIARKSFLKIGKSVVTGYYPMNYDVAKLVLDKPTTDKLGGVVVIDHYVADPHQYSQEISEIAGLSGGKVVLGEIGAPVPDIHGQMSEEEQAKWLEEALLDISKQKTLIGLNYWVAQGGSTSLWFEDGRDKSAVNVIKKYFLENNPPEILNLPTKIKSIFQEKNCPFFPWEVDLTTFSVACYIPFTFKDELARSQIFFNHFTACWPFHFLFCLDSLGRSSTGDKAFEFSLGFKGR